MGICHNIWFLVVPFDAKQLHLTAKEKREVNPETSYLGTHLD